MKKRVMVLFLLFLLTGCRVSEEDAPDSIKDQIAPNIYGVENLEINVGDDFNSLADVSVYDVQDGYITDLIQVEGQVDESEAGMYLLKYRVFDSDSNQTLHLRYITVNRAASDSENIFEYGQFTDGLTGYDIYQEDGNGHANFNVNEGILEIELLSVQDGVWYRPRLNTWGVTFEKGEVYRIEFYAKADDERVIQLQAGELINYEPWFDKFDPTTNVFVITEVWTLYGYEFTMDNDTNYNGNILFEFGDVSGDQSLTTLYIDNIKILKFD